MLLYPIYKGAAYASMSCVQQDFEKFNRILCTVLKNRFANKSNTPFVTKFSYFSIPVNDTTG